MSRQVEEGVGSGLRKSADSRRFLRKSRGRLSVQDWEDCAKSVIVVVDRAVRVGGDGGAMLLEVAMLSLVGRLAT